MGSEDDEERKGIGGWFGEEGSGGYVDIVDYK